MKRNVFLATIVLMLVLAPNFTYAAELSPVDTGDTAFMFLTTALVFLMTPGLALFYGGMVRKKNVLNTIMNVMIVAALISIQWVLYGYTLAFGQDAYAGLIGGLQYLGFSGVGAAPSEYAGTIPHSLFAFFQLMFAIITPALITGAFAERIKFPVLIAFTLAWATLVYDPLAHWVWGAGGWLAHIGALDFAGGTVIHISSGIAGLVGAIMLGKRKGYRHNPMLPHSIPLVFIGGAVLWFGWFGFNAGSALTLSNGVAMNAFVTTNTAAAAAMLSWMITEKLRHGKPTLLGAITGAVVGLVAITPGAGFVSIVPAIIIGAVVSPLCFLSVSVLKIKLGYDDALDAFGCHGIGGIWGALATGLFSDMSINSYVQHDGLFLGGGFAQLGIQALTVVIAILLSGIGTFLILKIISLFTNIRVSDKEEIEGLDISQHSEEAYPAS